MNGIVPVKKFQAATPRTLNSWQEEIVPSCRENTILLPKEAELGVFLHLCVQDFNHKTKLTQQTFCV